MCRFSQSLQFDQRDEIRAGLGMLPALTGG
jgi:hypothetical protein